MDMGSKLSAVGGLTQSANINRHNMRPVKIIQSPVIIKDILTSIATLSEPS